MELSSLEGKIIGIISNDFPNSNYVNQKVKEIIKVKVLESLKIVNLDASILERSFASLSSSEKNKVILASLLNEKIIILNDFTKGLTLKEKQFFQKLFKKIASYNRKIILIGSDVNFYLNLIDHLYLIKDEKIIYETTSFFDPNLGKYIDYPEIVEFINLVKSKEIKIENYADFNDLLKAIYRLKA